MNLDGGGPVSESGRFGESASTLLLTRVVRGWHADRRGRGCEAGHGHALFSGDFATGSLNVSPRLRPS